MPGLVVKFDLSFFQQKIFDHSDSNILAPVSSGCLKVIANLAEIRDQVINNTHFADDKLQKLKIEISRHDSYRFSAIDGDVTFESFKRGLEKIGVTDAKALDYLTLFNTQNFGSLTNIIMVGIWNIFFNFWYNANIEFFSDSQFDFKQDAKNPSITRFSLIHRYITRVDKKELVCFRLIAEIENKNLSVTFKEMSLAVTDESSKLLLENKLHALGYKKLCSENRSSDTVISHQQADSELRADGDANSSNNVAEYLVFPINRFQFNFRSFIDAVESDRHQFSPSTSIENVQQTGSALNKKAKLHRQLNDLTAELLLVSESLKQRKQMSEYDKNLQQCLDQFLIESFNSLKSIISELPNEYIKKYHQALRTILAETIILIRGLYFHGASEVPLSIEAERIIKAVNNILPALEDHQVANRVIDKINEQYMILLANLLNNNQYINLVDEPEEVESKDNLVINIPKLRNIFESFAKPANKNDYYGIVVKIRSILSWLKNNKIKIYQDIMKTKEIINSDDYIGRIFYSEAILEAKDHLVKMQQVYDNLSDMQKVLRQGLGEMNSILYASELNDFVLNSKQEKSSINLVNEYKNLLEPDDSYSKDLNSKINQFYNGDIPQVSVWDYLLPWRWSKYNEQLEKSTLYQIKHILQNGHHSPLEHFSQVKNIIAQNKPSAWKWWGSAIHARGRYDKYEKRAYFICLFKAFYTGYISEQQLIMSLKEFKQKINKVEKYDHLISGLLKKYQINLQSLSAQERLQIKSDHTNSTKMISEFLSYYSMGKVENMKDIDEVVKDEKIAAAKDEKHKEEFSERSESSVSSSNITRIEPIIVSPLNR